MTQRYRGAARNQTPKRKELIFEKYRRANPKKKELIFEKYRRPNSKKGRS